MKLIKLKIFMKIKPKIRKPGNHEIKNNDGNCHVRKNSGMSSEF